MLAKNLNLTPEQLTKLAHYLADRLLERLTYIPFAPARILDLNYQDPYFAEHLSLLYPQASQYQAIADHNLLAFEPVVTNPELPVNAIGAFYAKLHHLPLGDCTMDLIIANLISYNNKFDLKKIFTGLQPILSKDGLLLFTMVNFAEPDLSQFLAIGDLLLLNKYKDPVVDRDLLNINFQHVADLENIIIPIEVFYGHALGTGSVALVCE